MNKFLKISSYFMLVFDIVMAIFLIVYTSLILAQTFAISNIFVVLISVTLALNVVYLVTFFIIKKLAER